MNDFDPYYDLIVMSLPMERNQSTEPSSSNEEVYQEQQAFLDKFKLMDFDYVYQQYQIAKKGLELTFKSGSGSFYDLINAICPENCQLAQRTIRETFELLIDIAPELPEFMVTDESPDEELPKIPSRSSWNRGNHSSFMFDGRRRVYYLPKTKEKYDVTFANRVRSPSDSPFNPEGENFIGFERIRELASDRIYYDFEFPNGYWDDYDRLGMSDHLHITENALYGFEMGGIISMHSNFPGIDSQVLDIAKKLVDKALSEFIGKMPGDTKPLRERITDLVDLISIYLPTDFLPSSLPLAQVNEEQYIFLMPHTRDIIMSEATFEETDSETKIAPRSGGSNMHLRDEQIERLDLRYFDDLVQVAYAFLISRTGDK